MRLPLSLVSTAASCSALRAMASPRYGLRTHPRAVRLMFAQAPFLSASWPRKRQAPHPFHHSAGSAPKVRLSPDSHSRNTGRRTAPATHRQRRILYVSIIRPLRFVESLWIKGLCPISCRQPFGHRRYWAVRIANDLRGENRSIHHPQTLNSPDFQFRVNHSHSIAVDAHFTD